jgi:hypothetical protein
MEVSTQRTCRNDRIVAQQISEMEATTRNPALDGAQFAMTGYCGFLIENLRRHK